LEMEGARRPVQAAARPPGRRVVTPAVLGALAGLALVGLLGSAAIFIAFPRVTIGGLRRASSAIPIAGLGDQIDLSRHGVIAGDPRVVLRVRLDPAPSGVEELPMHWRGRALEVWTGRGWRARTERAAPALDELRGKGRRYPPEAAASLEVPAAVDARVRDLSQRLAGGRDPVDAAAAVERWLSRSLSYTRELAGEQKDPIAHF